MVVRGSICGAAAVAIAAFGLVPVSPAMAATEAKRVAGVDRYETAAAISKRFFTGTAETVVLAAGDAYADALIAGPLAAASNAPLLLTDPNSLPGATSAALRQLNPARVLVIGGETAVSGPVAAAAGRAAGGAAVERIAGTDG